MAIHTFKEYLKKNKLGLSIVITEASTHTAAEAAAVHSVPVSNIVKSLLVKVREHCVLYLVPGDKRLDIAKITEEQGTKNVRMANADEVKAITGYSIGGVPPFGHKEKLETIIEEGFDENSDLIAAAGASNAVFRVKLSELKALINNN